MRSIFLARVNRYPQVNNKRFVTHDQELGPVETPNKNLLRVKRPRKWRLPIDAVGVVRINSSGPRCAEIGLAGAPPCVKSALARPVIGSHLITSRFGANAFGFLKLT